MVCRGSLAFHAATHSCVGTHGSVVVLAPPPVDSDDDAVVLALDADRCSG
jgi:hypothetical protein